VKPRGAQAEDGTDLSAIHPRDGDATAVTEMLSP
jgi:hypothetical protein